MTAVGKFICAVGEFIETVGKFISAVGKFIRSVGRFIRAVCGRMGAVGKFIPNDCEFIGTVGKKIKSGGKFIQDIGGNTKPFYENSCLFKILPKRKNTACPYFSEEAKRTRKNKNPLFSLCRGKKINYERCL